jgi:hypothetical protein
VLLPEVIPAAHQQRLDVFERGGQLSGVVELEGGADVLALVFEPRMDAGRVVHMV